MPILRHDSASLHYIEEGSGFPVLLLAPGGMRSSIGFWQKAPWDPIRELCDRFRVIALDQRNAGDSRAPIGPEDGWQTYVGDQLALLDQLGIERCHVLGGCIGGAFALALIQAAPQRVAAAVLQQPIGLHGGNRDAFYALFDDWAASLSETHPDVSAATLHAFRSRMYDSDFVFSVDREAVRSCETPLLVLMGNDLYHPEPISREIVALAPRAELVERWKEPDAVRAAVDRVRSFLTRHAD